MITAVIFDVDGTLVNSVDFHAEAWQRTFRKFGKEVPFEQVRFQIGKGGDQLLPVFWSATELQKIEEPLNEIRSELFKGEYLPRVKGFPKVRELVQLSRPRFLRCWGGTRNLQEDRWDRRSD